MWYDSLPYCALVDKRDGIEIFCTYCNKPIQRLYQPIDRLYMTYFCCGQWQKLFSSAQEQQPYVLDYFLQLRRDAKNA